MSSATVDARGKLCPQPLIMTKKALAATALGETITVLIDNDTSRQNVERFLKDNGMLVSTVEDDGLWTLTVTKAAQALVSPEAAAYCTAGPAAPYVICIKSDLMGTGDDDLGDILMRAFVNTIDEVEPLPGTIVLYNMGVFHALKDSLVLDALKELSDKGVKILVCGTCVDFYKKKDAVAVGTISNMYTIAETLAQASHVVYP